MSDSKKIILQRIVPHYRVPVFKQLYEKYGWEVVAAGKNVSRNFDLAQNERWLHTIDMTFPDPNNEYRVSIDVADFLQRFAPNTLIAEFSLSANWTYALSRRRLNRTGPKLIFWTHGYNYRRGFSAPRDLACQSARLPFYACADAIACYTQKGTNWVHSFLPWKNVITLNNTIDVEALPNRTDQLPRAHDSLNLLSVGRLTQDKNFPMLVRVFRKLIQHFPHAKLTLIGDGPDKQKVIDTAGDLLGHSIFVKGAIYDEEQLSKYFLAADLFVYTGAIGLAANQALGYGLPVVIFEDRLTGGPMHSPEECYIVDNVTGWRVPKPGEEALLQKLNEIFNLNKSPRLILADSIKSYVQDNLRLSSMVSAFSQIS